MNDSAKSEKVLASGRRKAALVELRRLLAATLVDEATPGYLKERYATRLQAVLRDLAEFETPARQRKPAGTLDELVERRRRRLARRPDAAGE